MARDRRRMKERECTKKYMNVGISREGHKPHTYINRRRHTFAKNGYCTYPDTNITWRFINFVCDSPLKMVPVLSVVVLSHMNKQLVL